MISAADGCIINHTEQHLTNKGGTAMKIIPASTTIREASKLMLECKAGALMVKKDQEGPEVIEGLVSKTDIVKVVAETRDLDAVTVGEVMTKKIIVATINDDVDYILQVMTRHKINHMPVIDGKQITGVVSMARARRGDRDPHPPSQRLLRRHLRQPGVLIPGGVKRPAGSARR